MNYIILALVFAAGGGWVGAGLERASWLSKNQIRLDKEITALQDKQSLAEAAQLQYEIDREALAIQSKEIQDDYLKELEEIRASERRSVRTATERLRREAATTAAINAADTERLRNHAKDAERDLRWTEEERRKFGIEAAEASAAAHGLNRQAEQTRLRRPAPPTQPGK